MEPILVEIEPLKTTIQDYPHAGEEFGFVIDGEVVVSYGETKKVCKAGESFYFTANTEHFIENRSKKKAKFVWVSTPPNF